MSEHMNIVALMTTSSYDYGRTFLIILVVVIWAASLLTLGIIWPRTGWSLRRAYVVFLLSVPLVFWLALGYLGGIGWPLIVIGIIATIILQRIYRMLVNRLAEAYKKQKAEQDTKRE